MEAKVCRFDTSLMFSTWKSYNAISFRLKANYFLSREANKLKKELKYANERTCAD